MPLLYKIHSTVFFTVYLSSDLPKSDFHLPYQRFFPLNRILSTDVLNIKPQIFFTIYLS